MTGMDELELRSLVAQVKQGTLSRRSFVRMLVGAGLSLSIDVNGRPVRRELQPVAGGR